jgi:hypothetical protein
MAFDSKKVAKVDKTPLKEGGSFGRGCLTEKAGKIFNL